MQKKYKILVGIISVALFGLVSLTVAYFALRITGNPTDDTISVTARELKLTFSDNDQNLSLANAQPGALAFKTVTVLNDGTSSVYYRLKYENLLNNFQRDELVYRVSCISYSNYNTPQQQVSGTCQSLSNRPITSAIDAAVTQTILENVKIDVGITHEYLITLEFLNVNADQNYNQGKAMSGRIIIEDSYTTSSLAGFVRDVNGTPLSNISVEIENGETATTNNYGYFYLNEVSYGTHNMIIKNGATTLDTKSIVLQNGGTSGVVAGEGIYTITATPGTITNLVVNLDANSLVSSVTLYNG